MTIPKTILLADDNADCREVYATLLESVGYRVLMAEDGERALAMAIDQRPDLVLLNLIMPQKGGHEVLAGIRAAPETESTRCVVLTGDARLEQMGAVAMGGADGFLTKPVEPRQVLRVVESILGEDPALR